MPAGIARRRRPVDGLRGVPPHQARPAHVAHPRHLRHGAERHDRSGEGDRSRRRRFPHQAAQPLRSSAPGFAACFKLKVATDALEESYRKLRELEKVRDDLMKMIVHDLKSPLTSVLAALEMVLDGDFGAVSEAQRRALGDAEAKAEDLLALIEDLLEVARIEETGVQLDVQAIAPAALLTEVLHEWEMRLAQEEAKATMDVADDTPVFHADKGLVKRVFSNLIQNALTHSPRNVSVSLRARHDGASDGVLFTVADNGPGIPEEYHEIIFRKFERAKTPSAPRVRSSGLGLAFCKLAVEAHGGRIWVQSAEGKGSQFHFTLPGPPAGDRNGREALPSHVRLPREPLRHGSRAGAGRGRRATPSWPRRPTPTWRCSTAARSPPTRRPTCGKALGARRARTPRFAPSSWDARPRSIAARFERLPTVTHVVPGADLRLRWRRRSRLRPRRVSTFSRARRAPRVPCSASRMGATSIVRFARRRSRADRRARVAVEDARGRGAARCRIVTPRSCSPGSTSAAGASDHGERLSALVEALVRQRAARALPAVVARGDRGGCPTRDRCCAPASSRRTCTRRCSRGRIACSAAWGATGTPRGVTRRR